MNPKPPARDGMAAPAMRCAEIRVNGKPERFAAGEQRVLLDWLREDVHLTSAQPGCREGHCGACAVLLDDQPAKACTVMLGALDGAEVRTLEGFQQEPGWLAPLLEAFDQPSVFQCGYCKPAFVFAAQALLRHTPRPRREQVQAAFDGLLCRCTGYQTIVDAVMRAADAVAAERQRLAAQARIYRADSIASALDLARRQRGGRWLAGGQQLVPALHGAPLRSGPLIDVRQIPQLRQILVRDDCLSIGAACTHAEIASAREIARAMPAMAEMAGQIGDVYVRAHGTIGGALAGTAFTGCYLPFVLATGASIVTPSARIPALDWFQALRAGNAGADAVHELIVAVEVPLPRHAAHLAFRPRPGRPPLVNLTASPAGPGELSLGVSGFAERPILRRVADEHLARLAGAPQKALEHLLDAPSWDDGNVSGAYRAAVLGKLLGDLLPLWRAWR